MPILYWQLDTAALGTVATVNDFARVDSGAANAPTVSRFYWNNNAAFLGHNQVGFGRVDQASGSLVGLSAGADRPISMMGILGSPGSPGPFGPDPVNVDEPLPTAARGSFLIHGAGRDGLFLGRTDRGAISRARGGPLHYGFTFLIEDGRWITETENSTKRISIDLASDFDDIIVGGN
jgi:hypothetical protein